MLRYQFSKWIFLFLICFFSAFQGKTQSKQMNKKVQQALNNYVDYINDNIHALWAFHLQFRKFNNDLVNYYLTPYSNRRGKEPVFTYEDILNNRASYNLLPYETYLKTLKESQVIPANQRTPLNSKLRELKEIVKSLNLLARDVHAYSEQQIYRTDAQIEDGFELLKRIEDVYNQFKTAKDDLYFSLESTFMSYKPSSDLEEYYRHSEQLRELVDYSREIMEDTKHQNKKGVAQYCAMLKSAIIAIRDQEQVDMSGGVIHYDPLRKVGDGLYVRYDFVLQQAKKIHDYGEKYIASEENNAEYGPNGASYYFYNKRLAYNFNRYGRGVVLQYNKYVDSSHVFLLKMVEEPHWFKAAHFKSFKSELFQDDDFQKDNPLPTTPLDGYAANNLIFLLDVSSSMNTPEKLELLKSSVKELRTHMRPQDHISIIKYSGEAEVILAPTSSVEKDKIHDAIDRLKPGGKSNVENGLRLAYNVLEEHYISSGNNKIILASDGDFDVQKKTLRYIKTQSDEDKLLSIFYFGRIEKDDLRSKLTEMTDMGRGNYSYVRRDNLNIILIEEAKRMLN